MSFMNIKIKTEPPDGALKDVKCEILGHVMPFLPKHENSSPLSKKPGTARKRKSSNKSETASKKRKIAVKARRKKTPVKKSVTNKLPKNPALKSKPRQKLKTVKSEEVRNLVKEETDHNVEEADVICIDDNELVFPRQWRDEEIIAETAKVFVPIAKNVMKLLDQDCTVPFIARYRKEMTGNMPAEKIREIQMAYENVKNVHKKVDNIVKTLLKSKCDHKVIIDLKSAKTMDEVEYLYAPFKPGSKRSLAERAKKLGLEVPAKELLEGQKNLCEIGFAAFVDPDVSGKSNEAEIQKGIQNIIADVIAKDREILDFIRNHPQQQYIQVLTCESAAAKKEQKKAFVEGKETQNFKFENYFNFNVTVKTISAHQVMAINRGESLKVLTVKLKTQTYFQQEILRKIRSLFMKSKRLDSETSFFIEACIKDAYERLLEPHIFRQIRTELTKKASKESVDVFCNNLKQLLLTPPVRGKTVIGIDPGFKHGCKVAIISPIGEVLGTDVLYLHNPGKMSSSSNEKKLISLVLAHSANLIAIGNGTACRETEAWLSNLIKNRGFHPHNVKYCIINESGASIYSVTKDAEIELPGMDPNIRSAVSIARRLQDPLLEYVKVEPKHLGVGMYQHDIPETMLKSALESVVVECVSFVGVDLNVCPELLLRRISGLTTTKVKNIIQFREANGGFINRSQLLGVKGLGPKSYEQCAGFVRVLPQTAPKVLKVANKSDSKPNGKKSKKQKEEVFDANLLDTTIIHPESYDIAEKFLVDVKAENSEIGRQSLVDKVKNYMKLTGIEQVALKFNTSPARMQLIVNALSQLMEYDIREEFEVPLFQTGVKSIQELSVGQVLTGRVSNVTNFGAFVDIGVGQDGLIHISKMRNQTVQLGNRVSVKIVSVDIARKRIGLSL